MRTLGCALVVLASLLTGCTATSEPEPDAAAFESAPCPEPNLPGQPEQNLGPEFSCGYLVVPENRATAGGRTIKVAVARAKARSADPKPDPLLYLTGGPGGPGLVLGNTLVQMGLNRDRDVIVVDQRGTLHAQPALTCPEIDAFTAEATGLRLQEPTTAQRDLAAVRTCRDRLARDGTDLSAFDTTENAADIADLRTALGIAEWNVYGVSYGSDLALQLLRDHPEGIRSIVVDSVVPPQINLIEQWWPSAAEGLRALFDACAGQPSCSRAYPELAAEFTDTVARLSTTPAVTDVPGEPGAPSRRVVIDGYTLTNLVVSATLDNRLIPDLPRAIHAIATGDAAPAAELVLASITPPGLIGYGLSYGVFCREDIAFTDAEAIRSAAQRVLPQLPMEVLSLIPQSPRLVDECAVWDVGRADASVHEPVRSDVPALLLTGTLDAVTPPSQAELVAADLSRGEVIRFPGFGHGVLGPSDCALQIVLAFLDDPTGYDAGCAADLRVRPFN